jgi:hypothetical protein
VGERIFARQSGKRQGGALRENPGKNAKTGLTEIPTRTLGAPFRGILPLPSH